ncbi:MAG: hypothetical protein LKH74_10060 [Levilactobacillus sp.]|uniref:DUF3784 domain-containing protein n=1 Tax=Levilactobacillus suantsaiihabitans TaxID=2487722 RepID=A0A4Z0JBY5_9LACO|nr:MULTISPECIES: hypothetical protein [Levilactobacillus]MCH4124316.1 hypothetical protein [Levilactobacillus sp.]MCI1554251.1 hypothetical protein [Levilactobacillus sp.]MCI1598835.1 hypothetical protein [Levilactobacillus sp.]TGD19228.1 hypothetical protein EGT51_04995 [Levilactobacillus suantsaiihabitans]
MAITILMICYTLLALGIGWYFYSHRKRAFLVFHPEKSPALSNVLSIGGILMMLVGVVAAIATVMNNTIFISAVLLVGVIVVIGLQLILVRWLPKG